jgi:plastocyanin
MSKLFKIILFMVFIAGCVFAAWYWFVRDDSTSTSSQPQTSSTPPKSNTDTQYTFGTPKKSAHYESNTPAHGSTLAGVPINVVIDFNFDLAKPSSISIKSEGKEYANGETIIDQNKLSMRRDIDSQAPDGLYTVTYNACWPDGSCHDGSFQFAVDRARAANFTDMTGQREVTIRMSEVKFSPANIRITNGAKVTWVNDDSVDHYVNADSHPAHTYLPGMNSRSLAKNASHSFTFDKAGFYPYHCSAHASSMSGAILVE